MKLSNKTIVITGASKGLGRETALRLCRKNPVLVLIARTKSLLEQTQKEIENLTGKRPSDYPLRYFKRNGCKSYGRNN